MKDSKDGVGPLVREVNLREPCCNVGSRKKTQGMGEGYLSVRFENFVGSCCNVDS